MKTTFLTILIVGFLIGNVQSSGKEQGIVFEKMPWAKVLEKAKKENKLIFFDAYASWCGPCKMLQKNVFTRADVADVFNKKFINVKYDMEIGEGESLARVYPLQAYPTLMFINANGKIVQQVVGYQSPEALIQIGNAVAGKK